MGAHAVPGASNGVPPSADAAQKIQKSIERWRGFPNTNEYAFYDFMTQSVVLSSVNTKQFQQAGASKDPELLLRLNKMVIHEITHYVDHVATAWGRENLISLFDATNARVTEQTGEYWRIAELFRELRRLHYAEYYTHYSDLAFQEPPHPWRANLSCGIQFGADGRPREDAPIPFMKFNAPDGSYICRVPFSIASLLEVNAVASEIVLDTGNVLRQGADDQIVGLSLLKQHYSRLLSNPLLAEYTVAAHHVANRLGLFDIVGAFLNASALSTVALNVPSSAFDNLIVPAGFATAWGERNAAFKRRRDRGYLFLCLIENAGELGDQPIEPFIENLLKSCGLPNLAEIRAQSMQLNPGHELLNGPASNRRDTLFERGSRISESIGVVGGTARVSAIAELILQQPSLLPYIFLGDNKLVYRSEQDTSDAQKWVNDAFRDQNRLREFVDACLPA